MGINCLSRGSTAIWRRTGRKGRDGGVNRSLCSIANWPKTGLKTGTRVLRMRQKTLSIFFRLFNNIIYYDCDCLHESPWPVARARVFMCSCARRDCRLWLLMNWRTLAGASKRKVYFCSGRSGSDVIVKIRYNNNSKHICGNARACACCTAAAARRHVTPRTSRRAPSNPPKWTASHGSPPPPPLEYSNVVVTSYSRLFRGWAGE